MPKLQSVVRELLEVDQRTELERPIIYVEADEVGDYRIADDWLWQQKHMTGYKMKPIFRIFGADDV